jgi:Bacteriophage Mu, Gp27
MGRINSLAKLPPAVRAETERLILSRESTDSEIAARLHKQGFKISRSALGRHAQKMRRLLGDFAQFPSLLMDKNAVSLLILAELRGIRESLTGKDAS